MYRTIILIVFSPLVGLGQNPEWFKGATSAGIGNISSMGTLVESYSQNPAAFPNDSLRRLYFGIQGYGGVPGLTSAKVAFLSKIGSLKWFAEISRLGITEFSINQLGMGIYRKKGIATLGMKARAINVQMSELGVLHYFEIDLGGVVSLGRRWQVGFLNQNLNRAIVSKTGAERTLLTITMGVSLLISEDLLLISEIAHTESHDGQIRFGYEYRLRDQWFIRMGVNSGPPVIHVGFSLLSNRIGLNYGVYTQPLFGTVHAWDTGYIF